MKNEIQNQLQNQIQQSKSVNGKKLGQDSQIDQFDEINVSKANSNFGKNENQIIENENKSINAGNHEKQASQLSQVKVAQKNSREIQNKDKKVDIKKLIQMKQSREAKQKMDLLIRTNKQYFEKTHNSNIERCILCGQSTFGIAKDSKQIFKVDHVKNTHSEFYNKNLNLKLSETKQIEERDEDEAYTNTAEELFSFVNDEANTQMLQYILGKHFAPQFNPYVQRMEVEGKLGKWAKAVQWRFSLFG